MSATPTKTILHVDINSYFATMLQQENPLLRGKPIGVVKETGRTCIIAASKEAKQHGIKTGTTSQDAQERCPQLLLIPAAFDRYLAATKQLHALFTNLCPTFHIYSLDEAFLDITDCTTHLYPRPLEFAQQVQHKIQQVLGSWVTCNVGVSYNYFLAKLASEIAPKGTVLQIDQDNVDALLASVRFADVCGVGFRLERKLQSLQVTCPYQIRFVDPDKLERWVGPFWKVELLKIAYGEETHHFDLLANTSASHASQMKTVSRSITTWKLVHDEETIRHILLNISTEVISKVRYMQLYGRQAGVFLFGHDQSWGKHITLKHAIRHTPEFFDLIYRQLYGSWRRTFPIIKFGVYLGLLQSLDRAPIPLWSEWHQQERVSQATDILNQRYGLFTVRPGSLLNFPLIRPEVTGFLGDKVYHGLQ